MIRKKFKPKIEIWNFEEERTITHKTDLEIINDISKGMIEGGEDVEEKIKKFFEKKGFNTIKPYGNKKEFEKTVKNRFPQVFEDLKKDFFNNRHDGIPDFFVWKDNTYFFVEVKRFWSVYKGIKMDQLAWFLRHPKLHKKFIIVK